MEAATGRAIDNDEWIAGLKAGRPDLVAALSDRLRRGLASALGGRTDVSDADLDDFTQDAVIRVLGRVDTFRGDSAFTTWAMAVALRVSLTSLRRRRWAAQPLDDVLHELESAALLRQGDSTAAARGELLATLRKLIAEQLTPRQRQVVLAELNGIPQVVLADRLSTTPGAVYKVSHDARKKIKAGLARAGFDAHTVKEVLADAS